MHKPAVSIGMPVYNGEEFLRQALESVLSQSFSDFELIVSDNASDDKTATIVSEFQQQDDRIRYVRQSTNIGSISNFNYVLNEAKADYFLWMASDDLWDDCWLQVLFDNMSEAVAISFGHVENIDGDGRLVRKYKPFNFRGSKLSRMIKYYFAEDYNGKANIIYGMYHTRVLQKHIMRESYKDNYFGVDMLFVFDWLQRGDIINDTSALLHKRVQEDLLGIPPFVDRVKNGLFMLNRMKYFLLYAHVVNGFSSKILFLLLFPVKYLKSFLFNLRRVATRRLNIKKSLKL